MAGGRPTKYSPEILELARDYVVNFKEYDDVVPTIAGLACELNIARDTIYDWSEQEDKQEFSDIIKVLMAYQERNLVNGGLSGGMNPMITKLMLAKHGHSDKTDIDHSSKDGSMTPPAPIYNIVNE